MQGALSEYIISGIRTNIDLHKQLLALPEVMEGRMTTRTVENFMAERAKAN
jgi:acetyl-CoA carboxylase biotin carboxylase subunit